MTFVGDPLRKIQPELAAFLAEQSNGREALVDAEIHEDIPWRPHLFEPDIKRAWHIHVLAPDSDSWSRRIRRAKAIDSDIRVGVVAPLDVFLDEDFIQTCDELGAAIIVYTNGVDPSSNINAKLYYSAPEYVVETRVQLSQPAARNLLDRAYARAIEEIDTNRKGVLLEVAVALMLSQVRGFEVHAIGISNRSQQMDVIVQNRNTGGALGGSPVVLAEVKNWRGPVTPTEYAEFLRKLQSRHGRAKLGFLITSGRFTDGVSLERRRESTRDVLVVLLDGADFTSLWRGSGTITERLEAVTLEATIGD
ncbi:MAG: restriction endonuclease [Sphingomonas sp.]|uniref:restriction endonuclease n=1 Tax=Sphingomonas sp. TaxID=28214 RepID=UPI001B23DB2E|nr:restriction endonuclease [Sphingomonas sp.]MBO9622810.1 restriction endonuclease [Sphingomonas sp.]